MICPSVGFEGSDVKECVRGGGTHGDGTEGVKERTNLAP